ncbi:MAG TPA: nucleotidyltransferase family protein [candidate division Zixibacteria bacterium]|nr:nucleotidyltransferase family protein [candidate division Zixibacteria bacterium]
MLERGLILYSARNAIDSAAAAAIQRIASSPLAWEKVVLTASMHGVLPLVYRALKRLPDATVPAEILDQLRRNYLANAAMSLSFTSEMLKILGWLEAEHIKAIPFKGPTLAAAAYGHLTLRQFGDLDILIRKKDFERVRKLLLAGGYRPWRDLTDAEESEHLRSAHAYTFVRTDSPAKVDLHWKIAQQRYSFGLDLDSLWRRAGRVSLGGKEIPTLCAEDLVMVLCIHGTKHCWQRLGWICDVAEVVRTNPEMNWDAVLARAESWHALRAVLLGLDLAGNLLGAPLTERVRAAIDRDRRVRRVSFLFQRRLFARSHGMGPLERAALFFMARERLRDKLPHLAYTVRQALAPNELDRNLLSLPEILYFLYYPLRVMRLTYAAVGRILAPLTVYRPETEDRKPARTSGSSRTPGAETGEQ